VAYVRSQLESACCIWNRFYEVHVKKIERVQSYFVRFALRHMGWTNMNEFLPYESRCMLLNLEPLRKRRQIGCAMFIRDVLCALIDSPMLLMKVRIAVGHHRTRARLTHMLYLRTHRTNCGTNAPFSAALAFFLTDSPMCLTLIFRGLHLELS
jgi:hypothetical protein